MTDPTDQSGQNPDAQDSAPTPRESEPVNSPPAEQNYVENSADNGENSAEKDNTPVNVSPDHAESTPPAEDEMTDENQADELPEAAGDDLSDEHDSENETSGNLDEVEDDSHQQDRPKKKGKGPSAPRSGGKQAEPSGPSVVARYGVMRYIGEFSHNITPPPPPGRKIVVRTDRGVELAEVVVPVTRDPNCECGPRVIRGESLNKFLKTSGPEYPFRRTGRILRLANPQDEVDFRHLEASAKDEGKYCRQKIKELNLPMRLVTVEHMLGGERIVFYFTSEHRVDFRELVRDLASQFRTRIEMRQVGARDEARLVGDYERCGQRCCCQEFLKFLQPVSMRMAKVQKATLDPSKISGRCGRLMCCLRYEDEAYGELRKNLPRKTAWVRTKDYLGQVVDTQIITQLVRLALPDGTYIAVGVDELIERNMKPPSEEELKSASVRHAAIRREASAAPPPPSFNFPAEELNEDEMAEEDAVLSDANEQDERSGQQQKSKRRRGRRRRKKPSDAGQSQNGGTQQASQTGRSESQSGSGSSEQGQPTKKKRRRRRRKKKPQQGGGDSSPSQDS